MSMPDASERRIARKPVQSPRQIRSLCVPEMSTVATISAGLEPFAGADTKTS